MKILRKIMPLALCLCLLLPLGGCGRRIKNIQLLGCSLESFAPRGLRGADAELAVHIQNPAMQFTVSGLSGVLYYKGEPLAQYSAEPIEVERRSTAVYSLPCSVTLSDGVSLIKVLLLLKDYDLEDFTTDLSAKVTMKKGPSLPFEFKNKPLKELLE